MKAFSLANWRPLPTDPSLERTYIIVGAVVGVVVVLLVLAAVLIACRKRDKVEGSHSQYSMCLIII